MKSDIERIKKISAIGHKLQQYISTHAITKEVLLNNEYIQWTVTTPLYNIGEHVYFLSKDFKAQYPDIPWSIIAGLRHRLVHDYDAIKWDIIIEVIFDDIPEFLKEIDTILKTN